MFFRSLFCFCLISYIKADGTHNSIVEKDYRRIMKEMNQTGKSARELVLEGVSKICHSYRSELMKKLTFQTIPQRHTKCMRDKYPFISLEQDVLLLLSSHHEIVELEQPELVFDTSLLLDSSIKTIEPVLLFSFSDNLEQTLTYLDSLRNKHK